MVRFVLLHLMGFIVDLTSGAHGGADEKDLQIALLRHQVRLLQRRLPRPPRLTRWEKLTLAALTASLARLTQQPRSQLSQILLLVRPETVLKWHRELVRRKWTYRRRLASGRPPVSPDIEALILWPPKTHAGATAGSRAN
jgi:putative transposase